MTARLISTSLIPAADGRAWLAIVSTLAWGLGYFGQPHILTCFMSAKSVAKLKVSTVIAIIWVAISLAGAVVVGLVSIALFENLAAGDQEKVFIFTIGRVMGPWLCGFMLAAILSAIMSTIDSQLLVFSSALTEDIYQKVIKRDASEKEVVLMGRLCVVVISVIAMLLVLNPQETILDKVAYAWGGFGAAFGPLVLFALFSGKRHGCPPCSVWSRER